MKRCNLLGTIGLSALVLTSTPAAAQSTETVSSARAATAADFAKFVPKSNPVNTRIDYEIWDEALQYFVFRMGRSLRQGARTVDPEPGTRRVYGHDSLYRLEGNRIIFSLLEPEIIASMTEYRSDLERTTELVDISTLPRNEQLAFWINLHNAAIIEQIALNYPIQQPSRIKLGDGSLPFDETPFISVAGVKLSPKDIRTKIVFPNWNSPEVIYGFFRGDIGGPSIQANAYTGENVGDLLDKSARDFVNSLRGTQKRGDRLQVSTIYEEARPFFFPNWPADIRSHISNHARSDVQEIIAKTIDVETRIYEYDIADLANGQRDPQLNFIQYDDNLERVPGISPSVARLLREEQEKINRIIRRGDRVGTVTFIDIDLPGEPKEPEEVE